jgi:hypothetical protein
MPILFNLSDSVGSDDAHDLSAAAGVEVARALESVMHGLRFYEAQEEGTLAQDLSRAAEHFRNASKLFQNLTSKVPDRTVSIPPHLLPAWRAAAAFNSAVVPTLGEPLGAPPALASPTIGQLMKFAAEMTAELATSIEVTPRTVSDTAGGRRIAIRASVLQIFGTLISQILSETPRSQPLTRFA